jgi:hypothetical protein
MDGIHSLKISSSLLSELGASLRASCWPGGTEKAEGATPFGSKRGGLTYEAVLHSSREAELQEANPLVVCFCIGHDRLGLLVQRQSSPLLD